MSESNEYDICETNIVITKAKISMDLSVTDHSMAQSWKTYKLIAQFYGILSF